MSRFARYPISSSNSRAAQLSGSSSGSSLPAGSSINSRPMAIRNCRIKMTFSSRMGTIPTPPPCRMYSRTATLPLSKAASPPQRENIFPLYISSCLIHVSNFTSTSANRDQTGSCWTLIDRVSSHPEKSNPLEWL